MAAPSPHDVTGLLVAWSQGNAAALDRLTPLIYDELRRMARRRLGHERGEPLQATALVHEAYLKLIDQRSVRWQNRAHFYAIAARLMRRILIDHARTRNAARRGGRAQRVSLDLAAEAPARAADLVELDEALRELAEIDLRKSQVVELRFFGGLSVEEVAEVLGVSAVTVGRDWSTARAWLHRALERGASQKE